MATKKKEEEKPIVTPFTNKDYGKRSVSFPDMDFARKFEQCLIRYGLITSKKVDEKIEESPATGETASSASGSVTTVISEGCNWTKDGTILSYLEGNVGIGESAPSEKLEVAGNVDITGNYLINGASLASSIKLDDLAAPDDNSDLNVTIAAHGLMSKLPNDEMKLYSGTGAWIEIAAAAGAIHVRSVPSANTKNTNSTQRDNNSNSYALIKEVRLDEPAKGVRIRFTLFTNNASNPAYGQIYRNNVAIGTERTTESLVGEEFEEDFTDNWNTGDLIQIYAHRSGLSRVYVESMEFAYDRAITGFGSWNLSTGLVTSEQTAYAMTSQDP